MFNLIVGLILVPFVYISYYLGMNNENAPWWKGQEEKYYNRYNNEVEIMVDQTYPHLFMYAIFFILCGWNIWPLLFIPLICYHAVVKHKYSKSILKYIKKLLESVEDESEKSC